MDTGQLSTATDAWHSWFSLHAATHGVPQYAGGDGSIRLAVGSSGVGIIVGCEGAQRILTTTPPGLALCPLITPSGAVAWFHDHEDTEAGQWLTQLLAGGPATPLDADIPRGYFAGAAAGPRSIAIAIGTDEGVEVHASTASDNRLREIYKAGSEARVRAVSPDGQLVALSAVDHSEGGTRIAQVVSAQGPVATFTDLISDVEPVGFLPTDSHHTLVLRHSRPTGEGLLLWHTDSGEERELPNSLPDDITDAWVTTDDLILARCYTNMRARLYQVDPSDGQSHLLSPQYGSVGRSVHRSGGATTFTWSSLTTPMAVLEAGQKPPAAAIAADIQEIHVPTATGRIPALISRPPGSIPIGCTVFLVHGGPGLAASDTFDPRVATYLQAGFTVVQVNYRGSAGHGAAWRNAIYTDGPIAQAADLAAVRNWCVENGLATPAGCLLHGTSWGGYLALLAAGLHPKIWAGVIAVSPIADLLSAYVEVLQPQRDLLTEVFGGSPDQAPERYQKASPRTYTADLAAPILIVAFDKDARSPLGQIRSYVSNAISQGKEVDVAVLPGGHRGHGPESRIRQMELVLRFARARMPGVAAGRRHPGPSIHNV